MGSYAHALHSFEVHFLSAPSLARDVRVPHLDMMASTAFETLELLEWRLSRLEHFLAPDQPGPSTKDTNGAADEAVASRVKKLETRLVNLISESAPAKQIVHLRQCVAELVNCRVLTYLRRRATASLWRRWSAGHKFR